MKESPRPKTTKYTDNIVASKGLFLTTQLQKFAGLISLEEVKRNIVAILSAPQLMELL